MAKDLILMFTKMLYIVWSKAGSSKIISQIYRRIELKRECKKIEYEGYIYTKERNIWSNFIRVANLEIHDNVKEKLLQALKEDTIQFIINIKPHSHSPGPFKFTICKVINKITSNVFSSSDKPMQILQNNKVNLPAESILHFLSKNSIHKRISMTRSSLNV
ncbi:hypothetical protein HZS_2118 [Henneguya salminicola]|nr:hypothetical protein HZS_2118 [Henneguya salminicola]